MKYFQKKPFDCIQILVNFVVGCFVMLLSCSVLAVERDADFECGGEVYLNVKSLWNEKLQVFVKDELIGNRLMKSHDVYALYDTQTYLSNFLAMARRCKSVDLLDDLSGTLSRVFSTLENDPKDNLPKWICRGGKICNDKNHLLNSEVMLISMQYIGLISSLANTISEIPAHRRTESMASFLREAHTITSEHVSRWIKGDFAQAYSAKLTAQPSHVHDGNSKLFFTDKELWLISILAELAGIEKNEKRLIDLEFNKSVTKLFELFKLRVSYQTISIKDQTVVEIGDIDRGYWRLYADNRYAAYIELAPPVRCVDKHIQFSLPAEKIPPIPDTSSWDISHARRLVHALDAIDRNRNALTLIYDLPETKLPKVGITSAFANNLVYKMWNGSTQYPLFSNFWDGSNGWYRVAYDNGTGECREGTPPFGLTDSFPTGGYVTWSHYLPLIGQLGRQIYHLSYSGELKDKEFMQRYYPDLSSKAVTGSLSLAITEFMFLPSLVGTH